MRFYLGTHQPAWLSRDLGVPLLVSHRRLAGRRSLPRATGPWALDSGGFTELSLYGAWRTDARTYVAAVRRYAEEIGQLDWAAGQDWMVESDVRARTGASLRTHQHRTVANYLQLRELAPELPFIATLQGQSVADYQRCADLYERHGVDLAALPRVGVGSICRRQHSGEVEQIVHSLAGRGLRLHTFGAKVLGLARYADAVCSSDSLSWSFRGRHVPGCSPSHRSESNCVYFALAWHTRLLASLAADTGDHPEPRRPVTSLPTTKRTRAPGHGPRPHRASAPTRPATRARRERLSISDSPLAAAASRPHPTRSQP
ncbi:hypothetical protein [Kutzneria sp. NPDC051319]|uniref:deazapurine DNA modification protein DpdA family protein n=1 Tax=Kutzneria sp. NPDC051319 TaxID=3155047 RepID=UPI00343CD8EB